MSDEGGDDLNLVGRVRLDTSGLSESVGVIGHSLTKIGELAAGAFAVDKGFEFIKDGIDQLAHLDELQKQSEAVIKSTGGAAGVTAKQMRGYADEVEKTTGIQAENVQQGENMLLTFTNVKNAVGKGNDVFSQASKTLVDVAQAMGEDPKNAAIQLGKALNDPVKGITALTRIGVTFSDQQKQQIANFQKAGDTASAQKVILAELNKEFGGSADAFGQSAAGKIAKFHNSVDDLKKALAGAVLPALTALATLFSEVVPKAIDDAGRAVKWLRGEWGIIVNGFSTGDSAAADGLKGFTGVLENVGVIARRTFTAIKSAIHDFTVGWENASTGFVHTSSPFVNVFANLGIVAKKVADFFEQHWKPILIALGVTFAVLAAPVISFVATIIYAYVHFQTFRDVVNDVVTFTVAQFTAFAAFCQQIWPQVSEIFSTTFTTIADIVKFYVDVITFVWTNFGKYILEYLKGVWEVIGGIIKIAIETIETTIKLGLDLMSGNWGKAWDDIKSYLSGVWAGIKEIVSGALDIIAGILRGAGHGIAIAASGMWDGIKDAFKGVINWIIGAWDGLKFTVPSVDTHIPGVGKIGGFTLEVPQIPKLANGGIVKATNGGTLALIGEGGQDEAVVPLKSNTALGNTFHISITLEGVQDADSVRSALPDLINALKAGVGTKTALAS